MWCAFTGRLRSSGHSETLEKERFGSGSKQHVAVFARIAGRRGARDYIAGGMDASASGGQTGPRNWRATTLGKRRRAESDSLVQGARPLVRGDDGLFVRSEETGDPLGGKCRECLGRLCGSRRFGGPHLHAERCAASQFCRMQVVWRERNSGRWIN